LGQRLKTNKRPLPRLRDRERSLPAMQNLRKRHRVNDAKKAPSLIEGREVLAKNPRIRESIRYRSRRWESLIEGRFNVRPRAWVQRRLTNREYGFRLNWRQAGGVLLVLKLEGASRATDELNPILLSWPEFTEETRQFWMPMVRQVYRYRAGSYLELCGRKWERVPWSLRASRLRAIMDATFGRAPALKSEFACLEELKLEGRG